MIASSFSADVIFMLVSLAVAGVFVGMLSGLLGIGGGTVMVPLLRLAFGMPALTATATSLFVIIPTSISGAITHIKQKTCIISLGVLMGVGGATTSVLGVSLSNISPSWLVMSVAGVVIAYSAFTMLKKARAKGAKGQKHIEVPNAKGEAACNATNSTKGAAACKTKNNPANEDITLTKKQLGCGFVIGIIAGVISGYVGVGGGFIMVPLMCSWLRVPLSRASGTSLIAILILAIPGVIAQTMLGNVDYLAGVMLTIGSIPGAVIGARMVCYVPERIVRYIFSALLFVAAISLVVNEFLV